MIILTIPSLSASKSDIYHNAANQLRADVVICDTWVLGLCGSWK